MSEANTEDLIAAEMSRIERSLNPNKLTKVSFKPQKEESALPNPTGSTAPKQYGKKMDEEAQRRIEEIERKREEERIAQEEQDRRFRKKTVVPDFGLDSFMGEVELTATRPTLTREFSTTQPSNDDIDKEQVRMLKVMSSKGYFDGKKKKTLKELEAERELWKQTEEAKRQKEAEEARKRQELIDLQFFQERKNTSVDAEKVRAEEEAQNIEEERIRNVEAERQRAQQQENERIRESQQEENRVQREQEDEERERALDKQEQEFRAQQLQQEENERREREIERRRVEESQREENLQNEAEIPVEERINIEPEIDEEEKMRQIQERNDKKREEAFRRAELKAEEEARAQEEAEILELAEQRAREIVAQRKAREEDAEKLGEQHMWQIAEEQAELERQREEEAREKTAATVAARIRNSRRMDQAMSDANAEKELLSPRFVPKNPEGSSLVLTLDKIRERLPYYSEKPEHSDAGSFITEFARAMVFLRHAIYNYPENTDDLSNTFEYKNFGKAVGGYAKYIIENVTFLTFEEDVQKTIKLSDALVQVGMQYINKIRSATVVTDEISALAMKWGALIRAICFIVLNASNQKAIAENAREQKRRALSAVILKVQIISQKMMDMMFDSEMYNFDGFKALLSKISDVVAEAYEHIPTKNETELTNYCRSIKVAGVKVLGNEASNGDKLMIEKYFVLILSNVLTVRNSI